MNHTHQVSLHIRQDPGLISDRYSHMKTLAEAPHMNHSISMSSAASVTAFRITAYASQTLIELLLKELLPDHFRDLNVSSSSSRMQVSIDKQRRSDSMRSVVIG